MPIEPTVFLVDDDPAVRRLLTQLIRSVGLPVKAFESGSAFLASLPAASLGCLVMDVRMPDMTGLELQRKLIEQGWPMPVIVLTGYGDVPTVIAAFKAGAFDFVEKPFNEHQLLDTIQAAMRQAKKIHSRLVQQKEIELRLANLTGGERRVLDLMMAGKDYKSIARDLDISYTTVQAHAPGS